MLDSLCAHINNYFVAKDGKHFGHWRVENGGIELPFLQNGQYFRVIGSTFNDGIHQYPVTDLTPEEFDGAIWAMAVPPAVIALSDDIDEWQKKYADATLSPYQSESFGGYSYTKRSSGESNAAVTWQTVFADRLSEWRKI